MITRTVSLARESTPKRGRRGGAFVHLSAGQRFDGRRVSKDAAAAAAAAGQ